MPLLLQRYAHFIDSVIYLGVDMENRKLNKKTMKLNSKGSKSQRKEEQVGAYEKGTVRQFQNGERR